MEEFSQRGPDGDTGGQGGGLDPFNKQANLSALKRRLEAEKLQRIIQKNQDEDELLVAEKNVKATLGSGRPKQSLKRPTNNQKGLVNKLEQYEAQMQLEHVGVGGMQDLQHQEMTLPRAMIGPGTLKHMSMQKLKVLAAVAPSDDTPANRLGEGSYNSGQRRNPDLKKASRGKPKKAKVSKPLELIAEEEQGEHGNMLEEPLPGTRVQLDQALFGPQGSKLAPIEKSVGLPSTKNRTASKTNLLSPMRNSREKALEQCQDIKEKQKEKHAGILENAKKSIYPNTESSVLSGASTGMATMDDRRYQPSRHKHVETVMDQLRNQRSTQLGTRKAAMGGGSEQTLQLPDSGSQMTQPSVTDKRNREFRPTGVKNDPQAGRSVRNSEFESRDESIGGSTLRDPSMSSGISLVTSTLSKMRENDVLSQNYQQAHAATGSLLTLDVVSRLRAQGGIGEGAARPGIVLVDKPPIGMSKVNFEAKQLRSRQWLVDIPDLIRQMAHRGDQSFSIDVDFHPQLELGLGEERG